MRGLGLVLGVALGSGLGLAGTAPTPVRAQAAAGAADGRYAAAHELFTQKKYAEAAAALDKFLADFPKDAKAIMARLELGAALLELGKPAEAAAAFNAVLPETQSPDLRFPALYGAGRAYAALKDDAKAATALGQAVPLSQQDPQNGAAVRILLGDTQLRLGQYAEALKNYDDALTRWPDRAETTPAYYGVGEANRLLGNYNEAAITLRLFVDKYWRSPLAPSAGVKAGDAFLALGKLNEAEAEYRRVMKDYLESPSAPYAQLGLGKIAFAQRDYPTARSAFQAAAVVFAQSAVGPVAELRVADTYRAERNFEEAKRRYNGLLGSPEVAIAREARYSLGVTLQADGKLPNAAAEFTRLSEEKDAGRWGDLSRLRLAEIRATAGDHPGAVALIRPILAGRPEPDVRDEASLLLGEALVRSQDAAGADTELTGLLKRAPDGPYSLRASVLLGEARVAQMKAVEAVRLLAPLLARELTPEDRASVLTGLGEAQISARQEKEGVASLREVLDKYPAAPGAASAARTLLAFYQAAGQTAQANDLEQLIAAKYGGSSSGDDTVLAQADGAAAAGHFDDAQKLYAAVLQHRPDRARRLRARAGLAESLAALKKPAESSAQFAEMAKDTPGPGVLADAHYRAGRAWEKGGNSTAALAEYRAARSASPEPETAPNVLLGLGRLLSDAQKPGEAEAPLRELITKYPKSGAMPQALYELAWSLLDQGKGDAARPVFVRLTAEFPANALAADAAFRLGEQEYAAADYGGAATHYRLAAGSKSGVADRAAYKLGWSLRQSGDNAGAAAAFQQSVQLSPRGPLALESRVRAGEALVQIEKDKEALAQFDAALKAEPATAADRDLLLQAKVGAATAYLMGGNGEKALALASEAALPGNGWYGGRAQLVKAEAIFLKDGAKAALTEFSRGASLYSRHRDVAAEAWFRSAECYEKLGDVRSAQAAWQRVVDTYVGTDWAKRAAERLNAKPSASGK